MVGQIPDFWLVASPKADAAFMGYPKEVFISFWTDAFDDGAISLEGSLEVI